jgi:hypothetical protein
MAVNKYGMNNARQVRQSIQQKFGSSGDLISSSELSRMIKNSHSLPVLFADDPLPPSGPVPIPYPNTAMNALAFAQGADVHLAPGQESFLQHEAWHVVQQRQGKGNP